jgi:hypothetical protein
MPLLAVRRSASPLRVYAAFPNNQHKFIAKRKPQSICYGARERNLIHIMFEGVAGVLAARRVIRVFASGCGFRKSKLGASWRHSECNPR